jgi:hypothetical protein
MHPMVFSLMITIDFVVLAVGGAWKIRLDAAGFCGEDGGRRCQWMVRSRHRSAKVFVVVLLLLLLLL